MDDKAFDILTGLIAALPGIVALLVVYVNRNKTRAEARKTNTEANGEEASTSVQYEGMFNRALTERATLQNQVDELQKRVRALEERVDIYEAGISILIGQIEGSGNKPLWTPGVAGSVKPSC